MNFIENDSDHPHNQDDPTISFPDKLERGGTYGKEEKPTTATISHTNHRRFTTVEEQEDYHRNIDWVAAGHDASSHNNSKVNESTEKRRGAIKSLGMFQASGKNSLNALKKSHTII
jgi:hypothetical protein